MTIRQSGAWACVCALFTLAIGSTVAGQQAIGQSPAAASIRLLRVTAGPRGAVVAGQYRLDEVRSAFNPATDSQAVVYFEWEGSPGTYRMAGRWQGPSGVSTTSEFEYQAADRRFGAYWVLPLSVNTPIGSWTVSALIDGVPAGSFSIEVTGDPVARPPAPRPPLTPPQLYERLAAVLVNIDATGAKASYFAGGAGLLLASGGVATAFGAVDAAEGLTAELPGGSKQPLTRFRTWSRPQDWAILPVEAKAASPLPRAVKDPQVGDQCYSLHGGGGALALAECSVVGRASVPGGGPRVLVEFFGVSGSAGAPVVNRDGELLGIVGSGFAPAAHSAARATLGRGTPVVPTVLITDEPAAAGRSLEELRAEHVLLEPVFGGAHIVSGGFSTGVQRDPLRPLDQRDAFTGADPKIVAFISWDPQQRLRGLEQIRLLNADNTKVAESKPAKLDLKPGSLQFTFWELPVPPTSGVYRAEVLLDGRVMWRETFSVTR